MLNNTPPFWVYTGGFLLSLMAGLSNAVGVLGLAHQAVTHVTGTATLSGIAVAQGDLFAAAKASSVLVFFFFGAAVSGVLVRSETLRAGRRYGLALMVESAAIFAGWYLFKLGSMAGEYLCALAFGLQNALATSYSGAVIRTTHMTGIVTDLGLRVGHALNRQPIAWFRFRILITLLSGFCLGACGGALAFEALEYDALLIPAVVVGLAGVIYRSWRQLFATE